VLFSIRTSVNPPVLLRNRWVTLTGGASGRCVASNACRAARSPELNADSQAVNTRPAAVVGSSGWADVRLTHMKARAITRIGMRRSTPGAQKCSRRQGNQCYIYNRSRGREGKPHERERERATRSPANIRSFSSNDERSHVSSARCCDKAQLVTQRTHKIGRCCDIGLHIDRVRTVKTGFVNQGTIETILNRLA
jgi:hypothetical protein